MSSFVVCHLAAQKATGSRLNYYIIVIVVHRGVLIADS